MAWTEPFTFKTLSLDVGKLSKHAKQKQQQKFSLFWNWNTECPAMTCQSVLLWKWMGIKDRFREEKSEKLLQILNFSFPLLKCVVVCASTVSRYSYRHNFVEQWFRFVFVPSLQPLLFEHGGMEMPQNSARLPKKEMSIIIIVSWLYFIIVVLNKLHKLCLARAGKCQNICYFRLHEVNNRPFPQQWKTTGVIWWINNSEPASIMLGPCNQSIETHFNQNQFLFIPRCLFPTSLPPQKAKTSAASAIPPPQAKHWYELRSTVTCNMMLHVSW